MAVKHNILPSPAPERDLLDALLYVTQTDDYEIKGLCNEQQEMIFVGTKSGDSPGRVFAAFVRPDPRAGAGSVLQLSVGLAPNAWPSLTNSRKNQEGLDLLIEKVTAALADPESSRPEPMDSHAVQWNGTVVPWTSGDFPEDPDED